LSIELRHWQAFVTAAETVHFGLAAEQLGISQSALSQLIKTAETRLGAKLFDRSLRRIRLTEAGRLLLPEARSILHQVRRAEQLGLVAARNGTHSLAIGYVGSAAVHPQFTRLVATLKTLKPSIAVRLDQCSVNDQIEKVADRDLDLGIIRSPTPAADRSIAFLPLGRDHLVVALFKDHPLARHHASCDITELAGESFIEFRKQKSGGLNFLIRGTCAAAGFEPRVVQTVPQIATMLCLVGAGLGIALVPASAQRLGVPDVIYRELREPVPADLTLMYRRSDTTAALREALKLARRFNK
jgi:DNA-binding transcriptional LysR family regulator